MNRAEVLDLVLEFAAPLDESWLGDIEFLGDAGEAQAFAAKLDETFHGNFGVHGGMITGGTDGE